MPFKKGQSGNPGGFSKEETALRRRLRLKLLKRLERTISRPDEQILKPDMDNEDETKIVVVPQDRDSTEAGKVLAKILGMETLPDQNITVSGLTPEERRMRVAALLAKAKADKDE